MFSHLVLVPAFDGTALRKAGEHINYTGKPDWKFQPLDPSEATIWAATVKRPLDADAQIALANKSHSQTVADFKRAGWSVQSSDSSSGQDSSTAIKQRLNNDEVTHGN
ncbi:hypothetical protein [Parasphingorhabdus sp.]|uniref:hypothetical protein n=1 Tax=Parasphingorhabdus sp. TaxID=2709688 RepID=UPI002F94F841